MSKVEFDMPHALVTLSTVDGHVEIEVWPKSGQSAYVVVSGDVAHAIAESVLGLADEVGSDPGLAAVDEEGTDEPAADEEGTDEPAADGVLIPSNIVDLASRRKPN